MQTIIPISENKREQNRGEERKRGGDKKKERQRERGGREREVGGTKVLVIEAD